MKHILKRRRATVLLVLVLVFMFIFTFTACNNQPDKSNEELQVQITDMQNKLSKFETQNQEMADKIIELETQNKAQIKRNNQLENENNILMEAIKGLREDFVFESGTFFSLKKAYNLGLIDRNDIMHISYFYTGKVYEGSEYVIKDPENLPAPWVQIDFTPEMQLSELDEEIEEKIKTNYFNQYPERFTNGYDENYGTEILEVSFLGKYNSCYAVIVDSDKWAYGLGGFPVSVGGIIWTQFAPGIIIFYYNP